MTRCIPQKQALTIHSAPNLASLHLCTCSRSVMQPLCLYPQSVDIHLFIWFQLRIRQPLSFPYYERRLGTCWHKAWARVYAQIADGESSVLIKEKRVFKDVFPFYGGSVGRDDQNWDFRSMRKVGINILSYFCKKKNNSNLHVWEEARTLQCSAETTQMLWYFWNKKEHERPSKK